MQSGVTLSTKDNELEIQYGPVRYGMLDSKPREGAYASVRYLYSDVSDIRKYYIRLGFHLEEFARCNYYLDFGFKNLEEFCERNLGLDKSAVSRCINVYRSFNASKSVTYENGVKTVGAAIDLAKEWEDYSYSQLCEMVSMDDEQRKQVKPDMTIRQIREIKKNAKGKTDYIDELGKILKVSRDVSQVATSQPDLLQRKKFDFNEFVDKHGIVLFNYIKGITDYKSVALNLFDKNGKDIYCGLVDFLYDGVGGLYIRLRDDGKDLSAMLEEVNDMKRCEDYVGVACVDGNCPIANMQEYAER